MTDGMKPRLAPVIVTLPQEIDVTNADDAEAQITAALTPGVTVVIADLTATTFCDSSGLSHLIHAHYEAAGHGTQLRLAISPAGQIARIIDLTGIRRHLAVYSTLQQATDGARYPASPGPPPPRG